MGIWETQEMEEAARNQQWEELNERSFTDSELANVDFHAGLAMESLRKAISELGDATKYIYGSGLDDDIAGYIAELESVEETVENMLNDIKKGVIA